MMANLPKTQLPHELRSVPYKPVEAYVRDRIVEFASTTDLATRLQIAPSIIRQAVVETLAATPWPERGVSEPKYQLVFRHDCQSLGCLDNSCLLCRDNQHLRCVCNFAPKYLVGSTLRAKCTSSIYLEVVETTTGAPASITDLPLNLQLEMCILDSKIYGTDALDLTRGELLTPKGANVDAESGFLVLNSKGRDLLVAGRPANLTADRRIVVPLMGGRAHLPDLSITDSSESLLCGGEKAFRLLVSVLLPDGAKALDIGVAISEPFAVVTPRSKNAFKADIPHVDDHVSKLKGIGDETQKKLGDIAAAAQSTGIPVFHVAHNSVSTVGQFRELVELAEKERTSEALKKALKLNKAGWELACDHCAKAVGTDNRMRIWYSENDMEMGLLYKCRLGRADLDAPVGLLLKKVQDGKEVTMEGIMVPQLDAAQAVVLQRLKQHAVHCWWYPGHPGWAIWAADSEQFVAGVWKLNGTVQIVAPFPITPHPAADRAVDLMTNPSMVESSMSRLYSADHHPASQPLSQQPFHSSPMPLQPPFHSAAQSSQLYGRAFPEHLGGAVPGDGQNVGVPLNGPEGLSFVHPPHTPQGSAMPGEILPDSPFIHARPKLENGGETAAELARRDAMLQSLDSVLRHRAIAGNTEMPAMLSDILDIPSLDSKEWSSFLQQAGATRRTSKEMFAELLGTHYDAGRLASQANPGAPSLAGLSQDDKLKAISLALVYDPTTGEHMSFLKSTDSGLMMVDTTDDPSDPFHMLHNMMSS